MAASYRRFALAALAVAMGLTGGLALLNYLVDPYNRYGLNRLGVYISAERQWKATEVRRYPHNALLLGNSRMAGIPPRELRGFRFFNAAFSGATAEEIYYFAKHFATNIDLVVLGVDLGACDPHPSLLVGDIFAPPSCRAVLDNLFNLNTVECSLRTIDGHLSGRPKPNGPDGSYNGLPWFENADENNPALRDWTLAAWEHIADSYPTPAPEKLSYYRKLADCLRQRGIPCVVFIPPLHEKLAQHLRSLPNLAAYQAWRRELSGIFSNIVDLSFSSYGAADNFFKVDPVHFRPEVGVRMINTEVVPLALRLVSSGASHHLSNPESAQLGNARN
jgi:hypothetical protein